MNNLYKRVSLVDRVFEQLENEILLGQYSHGEVITELHLAEKMGVSRTPIHDALVRLEEDKLIIGVSKGYRVLGITTDDLVDIMDIRISVEGLAAYYCAKLHTDAEIAELAHIIELQDFYASKGDLDRIKETDDQFHLSICEYCRHPIISGTLVPLHKRIQRYRRASIQITGRSEMMAGEHRAIYEAIACRDAELARRLTVRHIENAKASMLKAEGN